MRYRRIILIPGYGLGPRSWDPLLRYLGLAQEQEIVRYRYDTGSGESGARPSAVLGLLADRLRQDLIDPRPTLVIAFSLGTAVLGAALRTGARGSPALRTGARGSPALRTGARGNPALRAGARGSPALRDARGNPTGIVTLGGLPGPEQLSTAYAAIADDLPHTHDQDAALTNLSAATDEGRALVAAELASFPLDLRQRLALPSESSTLRERTAIPWLLVLGRDDQILMSPDTPDLDRLTSRGTVRWIEGGHAVHLDSPRATAEAIRSWDDDR